MIIILNFLIVLTGVFLYTTINLLMKNEKLEDIIVSKESYFNDVDKQVKNILNNLEDLDSKGTFKSDDEIGWFFERFKQIISILDKYRQNETK